MLMSTQISATNRRARQAQQEFKTTRRRNSTLTATRTFRRGSQYQEIQVAALPDLSENLINESQTWEEIREIKAMPVPMAQKRELKNQLQVNKSLAEVSKTGDDVRAKNSRRFSLLAEISLKSFVSSIRQHCDFNDRKILSLFFRPLQNAANFYATE